MKLFTGKTAALAALALSLPAFAEEVQVAAAAPASEIGLNTVWVLIGAFLVCFMQAGFGMLEAGFIRAKNTCNILTKNFLDFCVAVLAYFAVGYAFMFGAGNGFIGLKGFCLAGLEPTTSGLPLYAFWLFQAAFCGAAASIVAGGMCERMHFRAYVFTSLMISMVVYPIVGHWVWGGGWLSHFGGANFVDFAGSGVVHVTGGIAALVGTVFLGPRRGKYSIDGTPRAIPAHSIPLACLGVFILWFGWFGFNAGSSLAVGDGSLIGRVAMNTMLSSAAGGMVAMLIVTLKFGKPDLSMAMNGTLIGLVSVTGPSGFIDPWAAVVIGAVSGWLVVFGVELLDKLRIDDPVGAFPVHGLGGMWGCISAGLFAKAGLTGGAEGLVYSGNPALLGIQLVGVVSIAAFSAIVMGSLFKLLDKTIGMRVSEDEELRGLDIGEHGMESYGGFQVFNG